MSKYINTKTVTSALVAMMAFDLVKPYWDGIRGRIGF
jgi:hypothetical protein